MKDTSVENNYSGMCAGIGGAVSNNIFSKYSTDISTGENKSQTNSERDGETRHALNFGATQSKGNYQ